MVLDVGDSESRVRVVITHTVAGHAGGERKSGNTEGAVFRI